jgi:non-specific serine/threonine protein kinase
MLKALYYCHRVVDVIHRDIKPDNIMINHNNQAILIDFGVSIIYDHENQNAINAPEGSKIFFAPELLYKKEQKN